MSWLKSKKGFTLIELMIVVAIIGILAAIAIPRFASMLERSREGATKGNLGALRSAVSIYYGDKEGAWPDNLTSTAFTAYINPIPPAKATPLGNSTAVSNVTGVPSAGGSGWAYCTSAGSDQGQVWCNSNSTDSKGSSFTTY
jgi:prepilin-type N-terminal cleavage/methylation domain-containing protein